MILQASTPGMMVAPHDAIAFERYGDKLASHVSRSSLKAALLLIALVQTAVAFNDVDAEPKLQVETQGSVATLGRLLWQQDTGG